MYLSLVPRLKTRQVCVPWDGQGRCRAGLLQIEQLRQERRLLRSLGGSWIPNVLYRVHTVAALLGIVNDVHLCFRIVYADVAVFVVLCIALRRMEALSAEEL